MTKFSRAMLIGAAIPHALVALFLLGSVLAKRELLDRMSEYSALGSDTGSRLFVETAVRQQTAFFAALAGFVVLLLLLLWKSASRNLGLGLLVVMAVSEVALEPWMTALAITMIPAMLSLVHKSQVLSESQTAV